MRAPRLKQALRDPLVGYRDRDMEAPIVQRFFARQERERARRNRGRLRARMIPDIKSVGSVTVNGMSLNA